MNDIEIFIRKRKAQGAKKWELESYFKAVLYRIYKK